ncbi:MAG: hypothetical protein MMC23_009245 [Stictis urceolatum]|nr:hypothetical protein [Stictis urceolata]
MLYSVVVVSALAGLACAAPASLSRRQQPRVTDADILNYALTLEHLEATFYREGLSKFKQQDFEDAGFDAEFFKNKEAVAKDEATHVDFLTQALGAA